MSVLRDVPGSIRPAERAGLVEAERRDTHPFSGRGTTVFESLVNGRKAIGCDTNPVAACLSKSKADPPRLNDVDPARRAKKEERRFSSKSAKMTDEFFTVCFHEETLRQILFLKGKLEWRTSRVDCFIAALALGCLHGESHRTEACFSNRMPGPSARNRPIPFAGGGRMLACLRSEMSFRSSRRRPTTDISLLSRLSRAEWSRVTPVRPQFVPRIQGTGEAGDHLAPLSRHHGLSRRPVAALWFLGGPSKPITGQGKDDRHRIVEGYWQFLSEAWAGMTPLLQDSAQVVVRIGGTRLGAEELKYGLLASLNSTGRKFRLSEYKKSDIKNGQKRVFSAGSFQKLASSTIFVSRWHKPDIRTSLTQADGWLEWDTRPFSRRPGGTANPSASLGMTSQLGLWRLGGALIPCPRIGTLRQAQGRL